MKTILCGADCPRTFIKKLEAFADRVLVMPPCPAVPGSVSTHPDVLGFSSGDRLYLGAGYYRGNRAFFDALGCGVVPCGVEWGEYPKDVYFNVFALGDVLFGLTDVTPEAIKALFSRTVRVRQGYAKCSSVTLGGAVVTADAGIARAVRREGFGALEIAPGHVRLHSYPTGFIGGAVVSPAPGTLLAAGDIDSHPDAGRIREFAQEFGFEFADTMDGEPLTDCGGILIIDS